MKKGDIVLIPFPFTDLTRNKVRPGVILYENDLDIIVAFITSTLMQKDITDVRLTPNSTNGLKTESLLRLDKLATLDKSLAIGKLGEVSKAEGLQINNALRRILQL